MDMRIYLGLCLLLTSFPTLATDSYTDRQWTGLYAGVKTSYASGHVKSETGNYDPAFPFSPTSMDIGGTGSGIVVGYHWQQRNLVLGVEIDAQNMNMESSSSIYASPVPDAGAGCDAARASCPMRIKQEVNNLYTARLKVGHAAKRYVAYGTAGLAVAEVKRSTRETIQYWGPTGMWGATQHTTLGWTLGAGLDYALTQNILLQTQLLYVNLRNENYNFEDTKDYIFTQDASINFSVFSFGLSYKF